MNFLAHIFLSGSQPEVMAGNFMADSVKGGRASQYSEGICRGIMLHRAIDTYTDAHATVSLSKARLRQKFGKYAPVVADVFYDHYLASEWDSFCTTPLRAYVDEVYVQLKPYYTQFPERTRQFYEYMLRNDILYHYSRIEGIDRVMCGMARRARFDSGMETAAEELTAHYDSYRDEFRTFFPALQEHIRTFNL